MNMFAHILFLFFYIVIFGHGLSCFFLLPSSPFSSYLFYFSLFVSWLFVVVAPNMQSRWRVHRQARLRALRQSRGKNGCKLNGALNSRLALRTNLCLHIEVNLIILLSYRQAYIYIYIYIFI